MRRLGVSIYPEKTTIEKDKEYLSLVSEHGFERVFTCLLSVIKPKEEIVAEFKEIITHAKELGMEVILDVAPAVFQDLGISYDDLSFFADLGADGIRLDLGFDGMKESRLTYNEFGLKIELNMSNNIEYLPNIISHQANKNRLIGCHNFYPQRYTGLPYDFFIECSNRFKRHGLTTAAFVSSQHGTIGPWDINDGLCTLETHRDLPIQIQAKHLWATGVIDDVIIGNSYASEAEIIALGNLNRELLELDITLLDNVTETEENVILDEMHFRRGDISEYMIRSTEVRKKYKDYDFRPGSSDEVQKGDVIIGNNDFGKYKGELQVVLRETPLDNRKNVVAKIVDEEQFLIDYIKPWSSFKLKKHK